MLPSLFTPKIMQINSSLCSTSHISFQNSLLCSPCTKSIILYIFNNFFYNVLLELDIQENFVYLLYNYIFYEISKQVAIHL